MNVSECTYILSKLCLQSYTYILYIKEEYVKINGHYIWVSVNPI